MSSKMRWNAESGPNFAMSVPRRMYCASTLRHKRLTPRSRFVRQHREPNNFQLTVRNVAGFSWDNLTNSGTETGPTGGVTLFPGQQEVPEKSVETPSAQAAPPARITRRVTGGLLLAASAAVLGGYGALPLCCQHAQARLPPPLPLPPCSGPLDGQLAAALTRAVYSAVVQLQVMDEADFQRENFKLREREYKYYAEANRAQLPRIPDLADNTGGLSNPTYFNFIHYCLWKVVYRHLTAPEDREAFERETAKEFLSNLSRVRFEPGSGEKRMLLPDGRATGEVAEAASVTAAAGAPDSLVRSVVLPLLELLHAGGYICRYQLVLGAHPGTWPQDWMVSQPTIVVLDGAAATGELGGGGGTGTQGIAEAGTDGFQAGCEFLFQVKLHRPADVLGSVALRSEESGAWPRTVSHCLALLLEQEVQRQGCRNGAAAAAAADATGRRQASPSSASLSSAAAAPQSSEVQFSDVLDVQGGFGFGPRCQAAECDEFFYQDQWQGPKSFKDKVLLFFGDPLEQVGVDFVPTTLVQNWRLRVPAVAAAAETAAVKE